MGVGPVLRRSFAFLIEEEPNMAPKKRQRTSAPSKMADISPVQLKLKDWLAKVYELRHGGDHDHPWPLEKGGNILNMVRRVWDDEDNLARASLDFVQKLGLMTDTSTLTDFREKYVTMKARPKGALLLCFPFSFPQVQFNAFGLGIDVAHPESLFGFSVCECVIYHQKDWVALPCPSLAGPQQKDQTRLRFWPFKVLREIVLGWPLLVSNICSRNGRPRREALRQPASCSGQCRMVPFGGAQ